MTDDEGRRRGELPPTARRYDAWQVVSSFQKSIRRSDVDAALYWGFELYRSDYPDWAWKRVRVISSEDVSPTAGVVADVEALYARYVDFKRKARKPVSPDEGLMWFAHAVILLATASKARVVDWAVMAHRSDHVERREIPPEALDMHTLAGRKRGRGMEHFVAEASKLEEFTGSLAELEDEYRSRVRVERVEKVRGLPVNPWRRDPESNQLTMGE